jgi:hypothetical protein
MPEPRHRQVDSNQRSAFWGTAAAAACPRTADATRTATGGRPAADSGPVVPTAPDPPPALEPPTQLGTIPIEEPPTGPDTIG